jgi:hypothetical protein
METPDLPSDATADQLRHLALDYNWDDGFSFPCAIADHPSCDLAVALELFWLANADEVYLGEASRDRYNADWYDFSEFIGKRIIEGHYKIGHGSFKVPLTKVQIYKFRKRGLPDVFLSEVGGVRA